MAIGRIQVERNTSVFADQDLLDRLKLVPLVCAAASQVRSAGAAAPVNPRWPLARPLLICRLKYCLVFD